MGLLLGLVPLWFAVGSVTVVEWGFGVRGWVLGMRFVGRLVAIDWLKLGLGLGVGSVNWLVELGGG